MDVPFRPTRALSCHQSLSHTMFIDHRGEEGRKGEKGPRHSRVLRAAVGLSESAQSTAPHPLTVTYEMISRFRFTHSTPLMKDCMYIMNQKYASAELGHLGHQFHDQPLKPLPAPALVPTPVILTVTHHKQNPRSHTRCLAGVPPKTKTTCHLSPSLLALQPQMRSSPRLHLPLHVLPFQQSEPEMPRPSL